MIRDGRLMPTTAILYYITDRALFPGNEHARQQALLTRIREAARFGVDFIQLREKDLAGRELERIAREALVAIRAAALPASVPKLLINGRPDVALAVGADGVHLPAHDLSPAEIRMIWAHASRDRSAIISAACHSLEEVRAAADAGVDLALFSPVFEKKDAPAVPAAGLEALRKAGQAHVPVLALGGVTLDNARPCIAAGAAGIAAIRLFQEGAIAATVRQLRDSLRAR